eukprot:PhF_6_TR41802/c0_g1_i1/m.63417
MMETPCCLRVIFCTTTTCATEGLLYMDEQRIQLMRNRHTSVWSARTPEITFAFHPTTHLHSIVQREIFLVGVFYFPEATVNKQFVHSPPPVVMLAQLHVPLGPMHIHLQTNITARNGKVNKRSNSQSTLQRYQPTNPRRPRQINDTSSTTYVARNLSQSFAESKHISPVRRGTGSPIDTAPSPPRIGRASSPKSPIHSPRHHGVGIPPSGLDEEMLSALEAALHRNVQLISELE